MFSKILVKFLFCLPSISCTCNLTKSSFLDRIFKPDLILYFLCHHVPVSLHNGSYTEAIRLGGWEVTFIIQSLSQNWVLMDFFVQWLFNLISTFSHSQVFFIFAFKPVNSCLRSPHALLDIASHNPHSIVVFCFLTSSKRATAPKGNHR